MGLWFVIISATLAASGSLVMEKMLQGEVRQPFYIQKVALDFGSIVTSVAMLFIHGHLSERPMDAFWRDRPLGICNDANCWGKVGDIDKTCGGQFCSCPCGSGIFVNWGSPLVWLTLTIITARGWMKGEVTKRTSTLEVAIAESFAPILIFFVGQPLTLYLQSRGDIFGSLHDWALNCIVWITPLSAMVFDVAENKVRLVMDFIGPGQDAAGQCCPLHSLLVILNRLESPDEQQELRDDDENESIEA